MKIATYNASSNSFINRSEIFQPGELKKEKAVNRYEKSITKGMVKFFLGMVYFATLMFSLFILLT